MQRVHAILLGALTGLLFYGLHIGGFLVITLVFSNLKAAYGLQIVSGLLLITLSNVVAVKLIDTYELKIYQYSTGYFFMALFVCYTYYYIINSSRMDEYIRASKGLFVGSEFIVSWLMLLMIMGLDLFVRMVVCIIKRMLKE